MATTAKMRVPRSDDELARAAIAGEGQAFAELYDRHEQRVYRFCLRLLGNSDDAADATQETFMRLLKRLPALQGRELNALAYVFTAARHACYDIIKGRGRIELSGEDIEPSTREPGAIEVDPERSAMLATTRQLAQRAHARLPDRQREVLALRELEGLSYEEIGDIMQIKPNAVAQLISRARIKLGELVRGDALESIAGASPDCERALPLLARGQDSQTLSGEDGNWLLRHLRGCATCRVRESTMQEAGASYRALAPIVPLVWLRHATIARAAELVGADWSELARSRAGGHGGHGQRPSGRGGQSGGSDGGGGSGGGSSGGESGATAGHPITALLSLGGLELGERLGLHSSRRRRGLAGLTLLAACLIGLVLFVGSIARDGGAPSTRTFTAAPAGALTLHARPVRKGAGQPRRVAAHRHRVASGRVASGRVVSVQAPVTSTIVAGAVTPRTPPGASTVHRKTRRGATHNTTPPTAPSPVVTTPATTPTATPPATTPTATTPTTSTPTTTTPPTTTTNPNTPAPTTTNPNTPPPRTNFPGAAG